MVNARNAREHRTGLPLQSRRGAGLITMALTLVALAAAAVAVAGTHRAPVPPVVAQAASTHSRPAMPTVTPPDRLGEVALPPGWSVTKLVSRIYGTDSRELLRHVAEANPDVADLSKVVSGRRLVLPAIPATPPAETFRVLRVAETASLDEALVLIRTAPAAWPRLRLCLAYHPDTGLTRDIIVDAVYRDAGAAHEAATALPADLAARVVILEDFSPGTILYSRLAPEGPGTDPAPPGKNIVAQRAAEGLQP